MGLPEAKGNKPKPVQHTTPHNSLTKKKRKKNRPRPEKKREKESPFIKAGGGGSQGFWNKNTTQRVEIFISKPVGLDLDGPLRGGCVSQPYLCFLFLFFSMLRLSQSEVGRFKDRTAGQIKIEPEFV